MTKVGRGYSWPPFAPGHEVSLKHGAFSPRRFDPVVADILEAAVALAAAPGSTTGYLAEPSYRAALVAWATCEARCQLVREWLADNGGLDGVASDGDIRPAADLLTRLEGQALKHRERLGLDPLARARLGRDVAAGSFDVARLMAKLAAEEESDDDG